MKYRAEIDGLRALAVIPVILFHAGVESFNGGFVGVDIFFVISGYLITSILIDENERGVFSILRFYDRRARRILPALFFIIFCCVPFSWFWMLPDPLENFGQSLVATVFFANNVLLSVTSGYWDLSSEYKPLLHTWSLGVEEQYYLIFPLFMALIWRLRCEWKLAFIVVLAFLSLILSEIGWRFSSDANFYSAITRAWELLSGSIAAFIVSKRGVKSSQGLAMLGLFMIVFSIIAFDQNTPTPSVYALFPVIGVVLLILHAHEDTLVAKLLSLKVLVWIGLISYSAYLWHQPLFAFARVKLSSEPSLFFMLTLSAAALLMSYFSWLFIERPFRDKGIINDKLFYSAGIISAILIVLIGLYFDRTNGVPSRIFDSEVGYLRSTHEEKAFSFEPVSIPSFESNRGSPSVLVVGDSYASDLGYVLEMAYPSLNWQVLKNLESNNPVEMTFCGILERENSFDLTAADVILFAFDEGFYSNCTIKAVEMLELQGKRVFFFGTKSFGVNLNWLSSKSTEQRSSLCQKAAPEYIEIEKRDIKFIPKNNYISVFEYLGGVECVQITNSKGELLSSDRKHLTIAGAEYLSEQLSTDKKLHKVFE